MAVTFFIPKKINVGFQERSGTYTGKLAYIIYFDEKGKLRKETSWNSWRDQKIDNQIHDNEPTSGFVLNKKAGGYSTGWNHRQTYVRVYDPRGFEFEITVPNLLYILENTNSIKGKGLEGDFVYGWDGKDLILIPVDAPDYKEIVKLNTLIHTKTSIKAKDLKVGGTYLTKKNKKLAYIGKFDEYASYYGEKKKKKSFFFYDMGSGYFKTMASISQIFVSVVSEECIENYAEVFEKLERNTSYSPIDSTKDAYTPYTLEEITQKLQERSWVYVYSNHEGKLKRTEIMNYNGKPSYYKTEIVEYNTLWANNRRPQKVRKEVNSIEEAFNIVKPMWKSIYLANGKLYREEK